MYYSVEKSLDSSFTNDVEFSPEGQLIAGGFTTNRQWPVRGEAPYAIQRLDWTGKTPFEIKEINIQEDGFLINFTKPVNPSIASNPANYSMSTYTHNYSAGYGSPEVDHTTPKITKSVVSESATSVRLTVEGIKEGHIHDFDLSKIKNSSNENLVHSKAYYTVNEIPKN